MAAQRRPAAAGRRGRASACRTEKAIDFGPSARRLLGRLAPERLGVVVVLVLGVASVALTVVGPMILGRATDLIFAGVLGRQLPAGHHRRRRPRRGARAAGDDTVARPARARRTSCPGRASTSPRSAACCCSCVGAVRRRRRCSACLQGYLLNGVVQRTDLRRCARTSRTSCTGCRWRYFDAQPRGELLSRVTNDIDNVSQSLQQTMSQLLTSLLTVVGVLVMMVVISPLLALIALVTVPLSLLVTRAIAQALAEAVRRAVAAHRRAQRPHRGDVHRPRAGQGVRPPRARSRSAFAEKNDELFRRELRRAVRLRDDHAGDDVHREPQLRRDRGRRRPAGGDRAR